MEDLKLNGRGQKEIDSVVRKGNRNVFWNKKKCYVSNDES